MADIYGLVISIIISGGIAGAVFGFFRDFFLKKKEIYMDIAKMKIATFEKVWPYYIKLSICSDYLNRLLTKDLPHIDKGLFAYLYCRFVFLSFKMDYTKGGTLFDSIHANAIIFDLIKKIITPAGGPIELELLENAGKNGPTYDVFTQNLLGQASAVRVCNQVLDKIVEESKNEFALRCKWLESLLDFEVEFFMRTWYGNKPFTDDLDPELLQYIKQYYPGYHNRIKYLGRTIFLKKRVKRIVPQNLS